MAAIRGSCLCGSFRFEVEGSVLFLKNCHCSRCRKMTGSTFATFVRAETKNLRVLSGSDALTTYERSLGNVIAFCKHCGSLVPYPPKHSPQVEFLAGLRDDDPRVGVAYHIYVASRAPWHEIEDDLPQFEQQVE